MISFKKWRNIPNNFEGECYIVESEARCWIKDGMEHREDGPSFIADNGTKNWIQYNLYHRLDGPAVENPNGTVEYCINDKHYSEVEYWNHPLVLHYRLNKILEL